MKILCVIPARAGSKGIPGKNTRMLAGKPMIVHTIQAAQNARLVNRVIVSTDGPIIADISGKAGSEVIWRPSEISGDRASSEAALLHVLACLDQNENYQPDLLVFLQCTSPLTNAEDIDGTVQALLDADADTAFSAVPFHYFLWRKDASGDACGINHDKSLRLLRQEREPQYLENGAVYVMRAKPFCEIKQRFFGKTVMHVVPAERCWEVDEPVDLDVAEVLMRKADISTQTQKLPLDIKGLALDFDGVFTDNRVGVDQDGAELVLCSRSDGWGLAQLKMQGIPIVVISTEKNPVVEARCQKLGLECFQGVDDKKAVLIQWAIDHDADLQNILFVGNDVNDISCLQIAGCPVVVADAHPIARRYARIILTANGGQGAIRELADLIMNK